MAGPVLAAGNKDASVIQDVTEDDQPLPESAAEIPISQAANITSGMWESWVHHRRAQDFHCCGQ